jgi:hypothetical protein
VISDIHGVSGRDMLDAIAAGQRDPRALAQLARCTMRGKIRRLEEALDCSFFTDQHAAVLAMMLVTIDHYTTQIEALTAKIEVLIEPWMHQVEQLDAVPGIGQSLRPGHHRRDRHRHGRVPHRRPPGLLGPMVTPGQAVGRGTQGQQRHRPRQPLPGRRPGRGHQQRRAHPVLPRREIPAVDSAHAQKEGPGRDRRLDARQHPRAAVRPRSLLPGPRPGLLRTAHARPPPGRNHVKGLQRLGYKVTIQPVNPDTGELLATAG